MATMTTRSVSPGGALLRASRVFSIPPPLQRPMGDLSSQGTFNSDTATTPHPTHLTITTPQSSRARGDWGLKRPLPLRSTTKSSTPFIRVKALDTFEHITEYGSAADHTLTLQKFQEIGLPLTNPLSKESTGQFRTEERISVFEEALDVTAESEKDRKGSEDTRWKFKGPWLAGMTEGDFNAFLQTEVKKRKGDFQKHLRAACANDLTAQARRKATEDGEEPPLIQVSDVTDTQFTEWVKAQRFERRELYQMIRSFLDLPPTPAKRKSEMEDIVAHSISLNRLTSQDLTNEFASSASPYAETGPPKTHPSAGLSYSRTTATVFNHPVYGPQKQKTPVKARVIMPKNAQVGNFAPKLGVGGFATEVPKSEETSGFNSRIGGSKHQSKLSSSIPGLTSIEPDKVGGSKVYVNPTHARIDPKGRVLMSVEIADPEAVAVLEGTTDEIPVRETRTKTTMADFGRMQTSGGYGLEREEKKSDYTLKDLTRMLGGGAR